ncbi:inositol monophosphatase family protein [Halobaculum magnesiiphilum]|uniref:fructose-bisphosphatase n=1 Tax=Halobaculum magnesiiphilum TaxID=1017351 RepID=A0A8T8WFT4_9EURY|nr:inositol monophosphatase family protein [Halobaculum magnesiiphilum]QZP38727.1 inositol monophosphatase [Halobaculum magnesiiphilum]
MTDGDDRSERRGDHDAAELRDTADGRDASGAWDCAGVPTPEALAETAEAAVRAAGDYLAERFRDGGTVGEYHTDDVKAEADEAAEELVFERIREDFPTHSLHGEESGRSGDGRVEWVVDPLDGTNNYAIDYPSIASAVAARADDETLVAAIYEPLVDDCYVAVRGAGATVNGEEVTATPRDRPLDRSTVSLVVGLPALRDGDLRAEAETVRRSLSGQCKRVLETWSPCVDWGLLARGSIAGIVCAYPDPFEQEAGELLASEAGVVSASVDGYYVGAGDEETLAALVEALPASVRESVRE